MKSSSRLLGFTLALLCSLAALAAPMPKDKEKEHEGKQIDAGTFGVYQSGHRVGTETFSIYQNANGSVINSEFKTVNAPTEDVQNSEMQLTASGNIRRYDWKEVSPDKATSVLLPNDDFLTQRWSAGPDDKEHEQPYLLPPSTSIVDDYFFIHREVLAWRYLALACKQDKGVVSCPQKQRTKFMSVNPRQRSSATMSAEFLGREKINYKGGQQDLLKLDLKNDSGTWELWLDDQFKVIRMLVVGENTIVDRD